MIKKESMSLCTEENRSKKDWNKDKRRKRQNGEKELMNIKNGVNE